MKKIEDKIPEKLTGRLHKCFEFSGDLTGKSILNIGCSFGWYEKFSIKSNCKEVIGIDVNEKQIAKAKEFVPEAKFFVKSALDLSMFSDSYFDIVTMFDVIEHLPKGTEKKVLNQVNRILKKEGELFISTPNRSFFSNLLDPAWYFGHRHYTITQLRSIIELENFQVTNIEVRGGFYEQFGMLIHYVLKWFFLMHENLDYFTQKKDMEYMSNKSGFVSMLIEAKK